MSQIYLIAIAAAVAFLGGWNVSSWKHDSEILDIQSKIESQKKKIDEQQAMVEALNVEKANIQKQKQKVITREVVRYRASADMDPEWVRVHDCSALSADQSASCRPNGTPTPSISDRDALLAITQNYEICQESMLKYEALQDWVRAIYYIGG